MSTIPLLCIDHLHFVEVPYTAAEPECPVCGCRYFRVAESTEVAFQSSRGEPHDPHAKSWLTDWTPWAPKQDEE